MDFFAVSKNWVACSFFPFFRGLQESRVSLLWKNRPEALSKKVAAKKFANFGTVMRLMTTNF
jgi:hypothetical protein